MAAGNGSTTQQLEHLEAAITGARPAPAKGEAQELANDLLRIAEAQAECKMSAARYVLEHAQYLHDLCTADAKQSLAKEREFVGHVLAAEERKMAELRRILGKIAPFEKTFRMTVALEFLIGAALFATAYRGLAGHWPWQ